MTRRTMPIMGDEHPTLKVLGLLVGLSLTLPSIAHGTPPATLDGVPVAYEWAQSFITHLKAPDNGDDMIAESAARHKSPKVHYPRGTTLITQQAP